MMDPDVERYRYYPIANGLVRPRSHDVPEDAIPLSVEEQQAVADECASIRTHEELSAYLRKNANKKHNKH